MPDCKQCQQQFIINLEDKEYYRKINVPEPSYCYLCRRQNRLVFRNERVLYYRQCDSCGKEIISSYSKNKKFPVFCQDCWWSDKWDPIDHGQEYNFNVSFFPQFFQLMQKTPRVAVMNQKTINSDYGNYQYDNRDCYLDAGGGFCRSCYYGTLNIRCKDCVDCHFPNNCELSYWLIDCEKCYGSIYLQECQNCLECKFCFDCRNCRNCFSCVNLRNQEYCIFNKKYSQTEYNQIISGYKFIDLQVFNKIKQEFVDFKNKQIHLSAYQVHSEHCTGNHNNNCHNVHFTFDHYESSDCKYCYKGEQLKESFDADYSGWPGELIYHNLSACVNVYNIKFSTFCWSGARDLEYCDNCHNSHDCFGCIGIRQGRFCLLNKQYSEEAYKKIKEKITSLMIKNGEYGSFFPIQYSPFAYNESTAQEYYPLTKKDVLKNNWPWQETENKSTSSDYLICKKCNKNYKIIPQEKEFYSKMQLPIPEQCPYCRHLERISQKNPLNLWHRQCQNCGQKIQTSYAPSRIEKIYCEACYNKKIL